MKLVLTPQDSARSLSQEEYADLIEDLIRHSIVPPPALAACGRFHFDYSRTLLANFLARLRTGDRVPNYPGESTRKAKVIHRGRWSSKFLPALRSYRITGDVVTYFRGIGYRRPILKRTERSSIYSNFEVFVWSLEQVETIWFGSSRVSVREFILLNGVKQLAPDHLIREVLTKHYGPLRELPAYAGE